MPESLRHLRSRMTGRDTTERHRVATPLELLFDLAFVIAFNTGASQLAHALAAGHVESGLLGFGFATFAIAWAWINFAWFASAYDCDDWIYRLITLVQMLGALVLALGLPDVFASLEHGEHVDNQVVVLGYVIMRVAMVFQWLRAARENPEQRAACLTYVTTILIAQAGWVGLMIANTSVGPMFAWAGVLILIELGGPMIAEKGKGGTPWHPHHIAERYSLVVIIALGEGMVGTMAAMSAIVGPSGAGWSVDFVTVGVAGVVLVFGIWWIYFLLPSGEILEAHRERSFGWGYWHIVLFGAIVAVGASLDTAAYHLDHHSALSAAQTVLTTAIPTGIFVVMLFGLYVQLTRGLDPIHLVMLAGSAVLLAAGPLLAVATGSMALGLAAVALTPWVTVVCYEVRGHQHRQQVLDALP